MYCSCFSIPVERKHILMAAILIFSTVVRSGELKLSYLSQQILIAAILIFSTWCVLVN
jgi:hypothetical protein